MAPADKKTKSGRHKTYHTNNPMDVRHAKMSYLTSYQVLFEAAAENVDIPERRRAGRHDESTTIVKAGSTPSLVPPSRFTTRKMRKYYLGAIYRGAELKELFYNDGPITDDSPLAKIFLQEFIEYKAEWWTGEFLDFICAHVPCAAPESCPAASPLEASTSPSPACSSPDTQESSTTQEDVPVDHHTDAPSAGPDEAPSPDSIATDHRSIPSERPQQPVVGYDS
ncbi:hypothetical protein ON010_g18853 [Phytophthora cinnamomi]|nr:hypothetical protein ON010_g18853 [Phytophthora cinnamomi]